MRRRSALDVVFEMVQDAFPRQEDWGYEVGYRAAKYLAAPQLDPMMSLRTYVLLYGWR